jgi:2-dehydropantoate 2-reductase
MARVAMIGPGSVGSFFAAHLHSHKVISCARRPFAEYMIESASAPVRTPAMVLTDPNDLDGPVDWVLVGVKAHQSVGASAWFDRACGPGTIVVALQNGIEAVERLTPLVHGAEVLPSVVYCGAELIAPGHVVHSSAGYLEVPDTPSAHALAELYAGSAARINILADYGTAKWRKLGLNVIANGITAMTGATTDVMTIPEVGEFARVLLREVWAVARADGADLTDHEADAVAHRLATAPKGSGTSMLYDRRAGRVTEHDAIQGAVVRAGARLGVPTPLTFALMALLIGAAAQFDSVG